MSFGAIAEDYDRLRPAPPEAAVDWLIPAGCQVAVDLGAGTGLLTRALARKVPQVVAVEPDPRMAAVLQARSAEARLDGIRVAQSRGEQIPLPDASADGVFASSAWHWLDPDRGPQEIARVLRDGGRLGVIWTTRDRGADWVREVEAIRDNAAGPAGAAGATGAAGSADPAGDQKDRWARHRRELTLPGQLFGDVETASFTSVRRMTTVDFVDMLGTYSGAITADPQERDVALDRARTVLERRFPGAAEIDVPMRSWCYRAGRLARSGA
jgi:SAM-dependent methyltransferase